MKWIWYKAFNITGTVHCGQRLEEWCDLLRSLIQTEVCVMGHMTGAITIGAESPIANFLSTGHDVHQFLFFVLGEHDAWVRFGQKLEESLTHHAFPFSLTVYEKLMCNPAGRIVPADEPSIEGQVSRSREPRIGGNAMGQLEIRHDDDEHLKDFAEYM
jgi:hypothetical protein